ncbi:MAG: glycosyltransferase family 4 protein [Marinobacter sp.]|uniref:glycosyltransferase family 4 protein n=1 Tax=Marinobacter sp. TaxID=50741 RepID=UPI00396F0DAA
MGKHRIAERQTEQRHILLVVRWPVGGIRTFLKYVISGFPSDAYHFSVLGISNEGMSVLRSELGDRVDSWTLVPSGGNEALNIAKAVLRLNRKQHFDAIHAHGYTSAVACIPTGLSSRTAIICTSHDILNEGQFKGPGGLIRRIGLAVALGRCRLVHSVSKDAESNLLSYFPFLRKKSLTIRNGIDIFPFRSSKPTDLHRQFRLDSSAKLIGFFGRFMSQKGFKYLVSAIDYLRSDKDSPDIHVVCYGSGAFIREEQCEINRAGLESYFTFVPFAPDVSGAIKGCDVVVMPSLWEACPLQPMEALCSGVPFVGSNCIGLREVLEKTPAIQVTTGDAISLAQGILRGLEMGREPFEKFAPAAAERFDVRKTAAEVYELYEKVIG